MLIRRIENIGRTFHHLQRARDIVGVFLRYGYEDLAEKLHLPSALGVPIKRIREEQEALRDLSPAVRLRLACEALGPTFVKMGQILSTRPDLIPDPFIRELRKLQAQVAPVEFSRIRKVLADELGRPIARVFESIEEKPLGSASIAQVHKARLVDGQVVVVKVQRPDIQQVVSLDLEIMHYVAELMEDHLEGWRIHRPTAIVEEITRTLEKELDFSSEAGHIERFRRQFEGDPAVHVPEVYHHACTPRVITMEYIRGVKASKFKETRSPSEERCRIAERVADLIMRQVFEHGFFHADPHPGNIHILSGQVICFLDFGMMGFIDQRGRETFADLIWGIARRNEVSVANALLRLAQAEDEPPRQGFEAEVADFMHQHFYRPLAEVGFARLFGELLDLTTRHHLRVPANFFIMLKSLSLMEGLVRRLNPQHDVIKQAAPLLRRLRLFRLNPARIGEGLFELSLDFATLAREFPAEVRRILSQIKTGEAKVVFKHHGLDPLIQSMDRVSNRLAFSVVLASLIIGSSLIIHTDVPPKWGEVPIIGLIGYLLSAVMGFWLLIAILRHGKM